jgi:hypothetical protein
MELDGFSEELSLAFEYQGYQHYQRAHFHRTEDQFKWQLQRDAEKRTLCLRQGVTLIEVPWDVPDIRKYLDSTVEAA